MNEIFRALADPTRREILRLLRRRDLSAGEIAQRFPLSRSTLSSHFNALRNAGLVVSERQGTSIVYSLNLSVAEDALGAVMDLLALRRRRRGLRVAKGIL
jgi:ArsR family transcriptional regulator